MLCRPMMAVLRVVLAGYSGARFRTREPPHAGVTTRLESMTGSGRERLPLQL